MAADQAEMLEVLLASTATWQSLTGAANVTAARAFVHQYEIVNSAAFPRALICDGPTWSRAVGTGQSAGGGTLWITFYVRPNTTTYATREARRTWLRSILHDVRSEMEVISNSRATPAGYSISHLCVRRISIDIPPFEKEAAKVPVVATPPYNIEWACEFSVEY